ncbi:thioredoxin TrxC [uncultured Azohydromonas sp.]|uniref:thioredoxin TrxC n=1 Tax=uncultured Azohydromonas sp. TaxID=487342 RepID=UPI00263224C2|nr:thioredoxin TrxC [uncultured Azohydromonas sp.]
MDAASTPTHVACPHCAALNRIPSARLGEDPVCGRCGQPLLDGRPLALTDADFERVTARTELPVIVDLWAPWCGPCRSMAPAFEQAARELKGRALLVKVDTDANPHTAARFQVRSIPTLLKLQQGREVARISGAMPAAQIVRWAGV